MTKVKQILLINNFSDIQQTYNRVSEAKHSEYSASASSDNVKCIVLISGNASVFKIHLLRYVSVTMSISLNLSALDVRLTTSNY